MLEDVRWASGNSRHYELMKTGASQLTYIRSPASVLTFSRRDSQHSCVGNDYQQSYLTCTDIDDVPIRAITLPLYRLVVGNESTLSLAWLRFFFSVHVERQARDIEINRGSDLTIGLSWSGTKRAVLSHS